MKQEGRADSLKSCIALLGAAKRCVPTFLYEDVGSNIDAAIREAAEALHRVCKDPIEHGLCPTCVRMIFDECFACGRPFTQATSVSISDADQLHYEPPRDGDSGVPSWRGGLVCGNGHAFEYPPGRASTREHFSEHEVESMVDDILRRGWGGDPFDVDAHTGM